MCLRGSRGRATGIRVTCRSTLELWKWSAPDLSIWDSEHSVREFGLMDGRPGKEASCPSGTQPSVYEGQEPVSGRRTGKQRQRREAHDRPQTLTVCRMPETTRAAGFGLNSRPEWEPRCWPRCRWRGAALGAEARTPRPPRPVTLVPGPCLQRGQWIGRELSRCLRGPGFGAQEPALGCRMPPASASFVSPVARG